MKFIDGASPHFSILEGTFGIEDVEKSQSKRGTISSGSKRATYYETTRKRLIESSTQWIAGTDEMSIADLMVFTYAFGLFSGNFDGVNASVLSDYPTLLESIMT